MTLCEFDWRLEVGGCVAFLGTLLVQSSWISRVVNFQVGNSLIQTYKREIIQDLDSDWTLVADGGLRMKGRLVVPGVPQLKKELFAEVHHIRYTVHPGTIKMYKDLKRNNW